MATRLGECRVVGRALGLHNVFERPRHLIAIKARNPQRASVSLLPTSSCLDPFPPRSLSKSTCSQHNVKLASRKIYGAQQASQQPTSTMPVSQQSLSLTDIQLTSQPKRTFRFLREQLESDITDWAERSSSTLAPNSPPPHTAGVSSRQHCDFNKALRVMAAFDQQEHLQEFAPGYVALQRSYQLIKETLQRAIPTTAALRRALTEQVLDISAGHCNNCGVQFNLNSALESPYILDGCGAVSFTHHVQAYAKMSSHGVVNAVRLVQSSVPTTLSLLRRTTKSTTRVAVSATRLTAAISLMLRVVCLPFSLSTSSNLDCLGHPICRDCMRKWTVQSSSGARRRASHIDDFATFLVACSTCKEEHEYQEVMLSPSLMHKDTAARGCQMVVNKEEPPLIY